MAAINFPAASESPFYNSETGVTYVYENGAWRAASSAADSFDTTYVKKAGDNMTGSLTLGGTQITLNSADGSSTFAGNVTCGSGAGVAVDGKGAGVFYRATSASSDNVFVAQSDVDGTQSTAALITAAGGSSFASTMSVGGNKSLPQGVTATISNPANAFSASFVGTNYTAGGRVWLGQDQNAAPTSEIFQDGSVEFAAGNFAVNTAGSIYAGSGRTDNNQSGASLTAAGLLNTYKVYTFSTGDDSTANHMRCYAGTGSSKSLVYQIQSDGTTRSQGGATFASDITLGAFNTSATAVSGTKIFGSGAIQLQRPAGATDSSRFTIFSGNTPKVQLHDNGDAKFGDYSTNGTVIFGSGSVSVNRNGAGSTCFYAQLNGAEMATISASGLIVTGDPNVNGGISLVADDFGSANQRGRQTFRAKAGTSGSQEMLQGFIGTTEQLRITVNGNIQNTNNSYTGLSDGTLKENIVPASAQWDNIKDIEVVNFNFKEDLGYETHKQLGVIAQQVEEVSPGLVNTDEEGLKSVNYSVLYMKSVKALQEAMERIESLETRIAELEAN